MSLSQVLVLTFLIGVVAGLRSVTAPAVVSWAARLRWLDLHDSPLSFMGSTAAVVVFTLGALVELVADKLPSTPSRTRPMGLISRIVLGGLAGGAVAAAGSHPIPLGAVFGAAGGIVGAFGGYEVRTRLVRALNVPDFVVACVEDAVAIGGGLFVVSRL